MAWPAAPDRAVFDGVLQSCLDTARAVDGRCFPAGEAWRAAWVEDPALPLYGPDGFHPSPLGTYLAALVVYENDRARRTAPSGAGRGAGSDPAGAGGTIIMLQRVAHETVARINAQLSQ